MEVTASRSTERQVSFVVLEKRKFDSWNKTDTIKDVSKRMSCSKPYMIVSSLKWCLIYWLSIFVILLLCSQPCLVDGFNLLETCWSSKIISPTRNNENMFQNHLLLAFWWMSLSPMNHSNRNPLATYEHVLAFSKFTETRIHHQDLCRVIVCAGDSRVWHWRCLVNHDHPVPCFYDMFNQFTVPKCFQNQNNIYSVYACIVYV